MSEIKQTSATQRIGIVRPALQHQWKFTIKAKNQERFNHITANTTRCVVNYIDNTIDVDIEENIVGDVSDIVYDLVRMNNFACYLHILDGSDGVHCSTEFIQSNITHHELTYQYSQSGVLTHKITINFSDMRQLVRPE